MKVIITGGAGFIGSQLGFYLLEKGYNVILIDTLQYSHKDNLIMNGKKFPNFVNLDIRDKKLGQVFRNADIIFHFAGVSSLPECQENAYEGYSVNVAGTANVLEMARRNGIKRVIFSSSSAVYENNKKFPLKESDKVHPSLLYSLGKKHAEEVCDAFRINYGMDICILRFFNVYGPHQDYLRPNPPVVSYIIHSLLKNKKPILHSDGKQKRDMIYVTDVLKLCEIVMFHKNAKNQTYNVGSGKAYSVEEVFNQLAKVLEKTTIKPLFKDPMHLWKSYPNLYKSPYQLKSEILEHEVNKYTRASIIRTQKMLQWEPKVSFSDGLTKTALFVKEDYEKSH